MNQPSISVIVVTKNEASNIAACLESVAWADECIVFDSASIDATVEICRQYTDKVYVTEDWPGDGLQKRRALSYATGDWILCLDADERVTTELKDEILQTLKTTPHAGFYLPFHSYYCGKQIRFGDWRGERHLRLFKRSFAEISAHALHCKIEVHGSVGTLQGPVTHYSFPNLEQVLNKVNIYSSESAKFRFIQGKKGGLYQAIIHGLWTFLRGYILKGGFLDGQHGFMLAVSNAEGSYYRYLKLGFIAGKENP